MTPGVTVFIPVYNEESILHNNVLTVLDYLKRFGISHEVIIGSNGSNDATERIGAELEQENPGKVLFFHVPLRGPGQAFAEALKRARYEYFLCMDVDLSFDMQYVDNALAKLPQYDAVIGSKQMGAQQRSIMRIVASECFIWMTNLLLRMPWSDYSIGAKAYRTEAILPFVHLVDRHTFYTQQILYQLHHNRGRVIEIPVHCEDRRASRFNLWHEGFYRYGKLFALWFEGLRQ